MINPNKDNLSNIKRWLRKQEVQDGEEINSKSTDRVHTIMARNIRNIKPLDSGSCNFCGKEQEQLVPISLRVCNRCYNKIIKKSGSVKTLKYYYGNIVCDCCLKRTYRIFDINPKLCQKCMTHLGDTHRRNKQDNQKQQQKTQYRDSIARRVA